MHRHFRLDGQLELRLDDDAEVLICDVCQISASWVRFR